jgi:hypothetical protein
MRESRFAYRVLVGKPWLGNLKERDYSDEPGADGGNIKMQHQEVGCEGMDWIDLAQDRDM